MSVWWKSVVALSTELPCHFLDSINITDGIFQPNKSIIFGGRIFSKGQYADIDYVLNEGNEHDTVKLHTRGCLCNHKPCIRICCSFGSYLVTKNGLTDCQRPDNGTIENHESFILDQNNTTRRVKLDQQFEIIDEKPCTELYFVEEKYQITYVSRRKSLLIVP